MLKRLAATLAAAVLSLSLPCADAAAKAARGAKQRTRARPSSPETRLDVRGAVSAGAMHGLDTWRFDAGLVEAEAGVTPLHVVGPLRFELPLLVAHRETPGADFRQTRARAKLAIAARFGSRLRGELEAGVAGTLRPGWPDPYQPKIDGELESTDRFGYWTREGALEVSGRPLLRTRARLRYEYSLSTYAKDPHFEPVARPNHLTPRDREEHRFDASVRYGRGAVKGELGAGAFIRDYFFVFARDARTGRTHAGPGGPLPNPLLSLVGVEPSLGVELNLGDRVEIEPRYRHEIVVDTFDGYGSFSGPHPSLTVKLRLSEDLSLEAREEVHWRRYGPSGYAEGPGHPPLLWGDRREDRRLLAVVSGRYRMAPTWGLTFEARALTRQTNFPPYVAGVYPVGRRYDIDWSYRTWLFMVGAETR